MIAGAGAKCFYTNRRAAKKCSSKVWVRFCPRPCAHKVQVKYAIPVHGLCCPNGCTPPGPAGLDRQSARESAQGQSARESARERALSGATHTHAHTQGGVSGRGVVWRAQEHRRAQAAGQGRQKWGTEAGGRRQTEHSASWMCTRSCPLSTGRRQPEVTRSLLAARSRTRFPSAGG